MACSGDPIHLCGGAQRLQLYFYNGGIDTWHTPQDTGYYEVCFHLTLLESLTEVL